MGSDEKQSDALIKILENINKDYSTLTRIHSRAYVTQKEQDMIKNSQDSSWQMWHWIESLVGHMAENCEIPNKDTATYGHIIDICDSAQNGVKQARTCKMPFAYVHALAVLVHLNNILLAICLGCVLGSTPSNIVKSANPSSTVSSKATFSMPIQYIQTIIVETLKCVLGSLLSQAFLEVGLLISAPFNHPDGAVPLYKMLQGLQNDLDESERLIDNTPSWDKPT